MTPIYNECSLYNKQNFGNLCSLWKFGLIVKFKNRLFCDVTFILTFVLNDFPRNFLFNEFFHTTKFVVEWVD